MTSPGQVKVIMKRQVCERQACGHHLQNKNKIIAPAFEHLIKKYHSATTVFDVHSFHHFNIESCMLQIMVPVIHITRKFGIILQLANSLPILIYTESLISIRDPGLFEMIPTHIPTQYVIYTMQTHTIRYSDNTQQNIWEHYVLQLPLHIA